MEDLGIFRKLAQCDDKEQMQRVIDEYNKNQKPMTNADRIRAMTDEELAKFLVYFDERRCEHCNYENRCNSKCIGGVRGWLRKPVEEVAT